MIISIIDPETKACVATVKWSVSYGKDIRAVPSMDQIIDKKPQQDCICKDESGGDTLPQNVLNPTDNE